MHWFLALLFGALGLLCVAGAYETGWTGAILLHTYRVQRNRQYWRGFGLMVACCVLGSLSFMFGFCAAGEMWRAVPDVID